MKKLILLTDFRRSRKKEATLIIEKNIDQIKNKIENVLPKELKCTKFKVENGIFKAKTGISIFSWGESIEMKLIAIEDHKTRLFISSQSILATTLFDYGKNSINIQKIILAIESMD